MAPGLFVYDCLFLNEDAVGTHILSVCLASVIETLEGGWGSHFQPGGRISAGSTKATQS